MANLTDDLLSLIIEETLPSIFSWDVPQPRIETIVPFNFSLVCRSWRALVLSSPNLWSSIAIFDNHNDSHRMSRLSRTVKEWLRLSGSAPLEVYVDLRDIRGKLPLRPVYLLVQERHRWRDADITIIASGTNIRNPQVDLLASPHLSSLSLRLAGVRSPIATVDLSSLTEDTHAKLQELAISTGIKLVLPSERKSLRLPHLDSLSRWIERDDELDDTMSIVAASPYLETLLIAEFPWTPVSSTMKTFDHRDFILVPYLYSLDLISQKPQTTSGTLDRLFAPSLQKLSFRAHRHFINNDLPIIASVPMLNLLGFLVRSCPPLVSLRLRFDAFNAETLIGLGEHNNENVHAVALKSALRTVSGTLEDLEFAGPVADCGIVELLVDRSDRGHPLQESTSATDTNVNGDATEFSSLLCPSLASISFSQPREAQIEGDAHILRVPTREAIEEMVVSRWNSGRGALGKVKLCFPSFGNFVKDSARVMLCVEEGLIIACEAHDDDDTR